MKKPNKPIVFSILGIGLLFIIYFLIKFIYYPDYQVYYNQIFDNYDEEIISYPEDYNSRCKIEVNENIKFPKQIASQAILRFDNFFKNDIVLTDQQLHKLLIILNDSASYEWGELGTPYFDRFITFYDHNQKIIGITKIDFGGQTYSTPYIAHMKWGLIKSENVSFFNLISEIEHNNY